MCLLRFIRLFDLLPWHSDLDLEKFIRASIRQLLDIALSILIGLLMVAHGCAMPGLLAYLTFYLVTVTLTL